MVAVTPVITTARPDPLPFAIVTVVPLGAKLVEAAFTDTIVPPVAGLFISGLDVGKLVLSPTRTYAPVIKSIFESLERSDIHGMIHCSGGAQTKILHFIEALHVIKDNLFDCPPLFELIQKESGTSWKEMYEVFNMGHRMEIYVKHSIADEIMKISKSFSVDAKIIGVVENSNSKKLTLVTPYGPIFILNDFV